ncbi:MAG: hypothetical protein PHH68_05695 [Candidatus Omnitrophica bacterium]|nr:hypothetical protein [Candidatus Omnitrophota bacterium]
MKSGPAQDPADKASGVTASLPSAGILWARTGMEKFFKSGYRQIDLNLISRGLVLCIVFLTGFFVFSFYSSWKGLKRASQADMAPVPVSKQEGMSRDVSPLKGLIYYVDGIGKRDIFRMGGKFDNGAENATLSKLEELAQTLKLVGISWSDDPDAMIEDSQMSQTFFVKKGQKIGEFTVENISKDKVSLRSGKEIIELK